MTRMALERLQIGREKKRPNMALVQLLSLSKINYAKYKIIAPWVYQERKPKISMFLSII